MLTTQKIKEEYLITNLPKKKHHTKILKNYTTKDGTLKQNSTDKKNIHEIENFQGRKEICIKQDFYAKILTYKMTMALKQDEERYITRQISKNNKRRYQINTSTALSLFKDILIVLLR